MAGLAAWLSKYADSGLALILALGVGILALADIAGRAFTDRDVAEIISKALQPKNPY